MTGSIQNITLAGAGQTVYGNAQTLVHGGAGSDAIIGAGFASGAGGDDVRMRWWFIAANDMDYGIQLERRMAA